MSTPTLTPADELEALQTFFAEVGEERLIHHLTVFIAGECDEYATGDCVAEHGSNVTCQECLEWTHA